jgi:transglutaminase-like putative cysteine protease
MEAAMKMRHVGARIRPAARVGARIRPAARVGARIRPAAHVGARIRPAAHVGARIRPAAHVGARIRPAAQVGARIRPAAHVSARIRPAAQVGALVLLVSLAAGFPVFAAEKIKVGRVLTDPQTAEATAAGAALVEQVSALANRLFPESIAVVPESADVKGDYTLSFVLSQNAENPATVLTLAKAADENASVSYSYLGLLTPEVPTVLARSVFLLWNNLRGTLEDRVREAPVYAEEIPTELLAANSTPMSVAVLSDGTLAAALAIACVTMDHGFRVTGRIGASLYDAGLFAYAYGLSATPGGTLYLKPGMGRDIYRVRAGAEEPQRIGLGQELTYASLLALPDGSLFVLDSFNKQAQRVQGRKKTPFSVFSTKYSYLNAAAAAPDGTIWFYDQLMKGIRIYTMEGTPVDSLLPMVSLANPLAPTSMCVGPDGSFVLLAYGQLSKFRRDGSLVWRLTSFDGAEQTALPSNGAVAVDWSRGLVYVADMTGRRIVKLLDRAYCKDAGIVNEQEERVISLRARSRTDEAGALAEAAKLYEAEGSTLMARAYWLRVQDADPDNAAARTRLVAIEVEELKRVAREMDGKARATLAQVGVESARPISAQAIQKYELILSKAPGDEETRKAMADLKKLFSDTGTGVPPAPPIVITDVRIANLFPSLMQWYAAHPAGAVTVKNTGSTAVEKLRVSLFLPGYMDIPRESPSLARLGAGATAAIDVAPLFKASILETPEDITAAAQVTVAFTADGREQSVSRSVPVTIYRNTALTWDDTRRISSYITPNETTVSGFAARVVAAGDRGADGAPPGPIELPKKVLHAMRVCDALGVYGITYVEDPDSPFSRALGKTEVVDTVRFPRVTLYNRTGDCDDTTALLSSLLESVGIRTAILTTPGHIFLAFDSGQPAENARFLLSGTLEVLTRDGTCWIPVETTVLSRGFVTAWATASSLVKKYAKAGPFEFIPVAGMRDTYPPLPLPNSLVAVVDPVKESVDRALTTSVGGLSAALCDEKLKGIDAKLAGLSGRPAAKVRIQKGVLNAFFGRLTEAETVFRALIAEDPDLVSPYVDLANIRLLSRDPEGALKVVQQGLAKNGDSALLNLLAARIYSDRNDAAKMALHFGKVQKAAPELAARYPELGAGSGGPQRAAGGDEKRPLVWSAEQ